MKKTLIAIALGAASLVPSLAFAYPSSPRTTAVHSYRTQNGTRVGSYLRRTPARFPGLNFGNRVNVRTSVRNNPNGSQSLVRQHVRNAPMPSGWHE